MGDLTTQANQMATRLRDGEVAALARAISLVDSREELGSQIHRAVRPYAGEAEVIGITGPPGAGKSTLLNALVSELRSQNKRVAVVAVDPSSPITGGAVLGDRTRMGEHTSDSGVFIRSLAARGHLGGLSASILKIIDLVDAAGWDVVLLETVGAGQSETEVAEVADINVVVNAPGLGDDVQAIKAGILEIADVLVVNKADSPLAQRTERQLKAMLQLRREECADVPVINTVATTGEGVDELLSAINEKANTKFSTSKNKRLIDRVRRLVAQEAAMQAKQVVLSDQHPATLALFESILAGECGYEEATMQLMTQSYAHTECA